VRDVSAWVLEWMEIERGDGLETFRGRDRSFSFWGTCIFRLVVRTKKKPSNGKEELPVTQNEVDAAG